MTLEDQQPDSATKALAVRVVEAVRQIAVHYGLWMAETAHQYGPEAAARLESEVGDKYVPLLARRIERALDLPEDAFSLLSGLGEPKLEKLLAALSVSWLAADGVWFRAIEDAKGMHEAKRINDSCWLRLGYFEAQRAKAVLRLPEQGGLGALKQAFKFRLASNINKWDVIEESGNSLVLRVLDCRVQSTRTRQGLAPYPCLSGGSVEYCAFAAGIDSRLKSESLSCPPEIKRDDCACAWKFTLPAA